MPLCPVCGGDVGTEVYFCPNCGHSLIPTEPKDSPHETAPAGPAPSQIPSVSKKSHTARNVLIVAVVLALALAIAGDVGSPTAQVTGSFNNAGNTGNLTLSYTQVIFVSNTGQNFSTATQAGANGLVQGTFSISLPNHHNYSVFVDWTAFSSTCAALGAVNCTVTGQLSCGSLNLNTIVLRFPEIPVQMNLALFPNNDECINS